jgi:hypothetical protein
LEQVRRRIWWIAATAMVLAGVLGLGIRADASTYTITPGGPAVTVTTTAANENATVTFTGTAGRRISLNMTSVTITSSYVSILNPDGTTLAPAITVSKSGGFIDTKTLPATGTYTIVVDPRLSYTGSMTLTLYDVPTDSASSITPGGAAVTVTTTTPGQNATATFVGAAGNRISLNMSAVTIGTSTTNSAKVSIAKPDGTTLVSATSVGTSGGFIDTNTLPATGTYTILVDPQAAAKGSMTLTLYDVPPDATATIVPGGAAVTLTTTIPGQNANATFSGTAGQRISLKLSGVTISSSMVSILTPTGGTLASPTSVSTSGGFIDTKLLASTGTYTIVVDPQKAVKGSMTLTLYDVPADASATATPGGAAVTITMTTPGQNGAVSFAGIAGQRVSVNLTNVTIGPSSSSSTKVSILRPDGSTLVAPISVGTSGGFMEPATLPVDGTYKIFVDPQTTSTGSMTLRLYDVPADPVGTIAIGGAATTLTTTTPGQNGRVTFSGTAGQRISLKVGWAPAICCLVKISITNPDGTTLSAPLSVGATGAFIDAKTLPATGTYTIVVDPQAAATGTTTLTLYEVPADVTGTIVVDGPSVTVTTTAAGQNARLQFDGNAGDGITITLTGVTITNSLVSVLKPDGTTLVSPVGVGTSGGKINTRLTVTGTYTIVIDPQGSYTGSMTLTVKRDNTAPSPPTLSLTESSGDSHVSGTTFFYRPAGTASSFTVTATASDGGSGIQKINFPGLSGGFTPTTAKDDTTTPYAQNYSWTSGATFNSPTNTVTAYDFVGNTATASFAVTRDPDAPTTSDNTATLGSAWKNTTQTVTLTPTDGIGAGVAATYYTTDGSTPTTSSSQGTSTTLNADGIYTVKYFSVDNVANSEAVRTAGTQIRIDTTAPTSSVTFPVNAGNYTAAEWAAGCAAAGMCGTASDALSGLQRVELSLRLGTGNYWNGSSFSSAGEVFVSAAGTASWSYAFASGSFPADGSYTLRVRAVDNAGNVQSASSRTFSFDANPPETTISSGPADPSNSSSASFGFSSSEAGSTFECRLDAGAWTACTSPKSYSGLTAGSHSFSVRATDPAGNVDATPATRTWTIDLTAPDTTITSGPANPTTATSATFDFTSEPGAGFQCQLDGGGYTTCSSPKSYSGLGAGSHTFSVRAVDAAGNVDPTPATRTWTIDLIAPETTITSGPADPTSASSASFGFTSEAGATFQCQLDGGSWTACSSPQSYSGLAEGAHSFQVRATDTAGNVDPTPATRTWTIDLTAPETTITSGPADPTSATSASFGFTSEPGATFQCQLDGGAWAACTSPKSYSGLTAGSHSFQVRATDTAGNVDATPASRTWTVDTAAPETTISSGPADPTNSSDASFGLGSNAGASFDCQLDGSGWLPCSSPKGYSGLGEGNHSFQVRATDTAGNVDASPASRSWTIDLTAPQTTIGSGPADPSNSSGASFGFSSDEANSTFECQLDGGGWAACSSPNSYGGLSDGSHTFQVRATDAAGNQDTTPATSTWTIDTVAPDTTIGSGPADPTQATSATFDFASEPGAGFQCQLDGGGWATCTSPKNYSGLSDGTHTFQVRASDAAGNVDTSPASRTWTVDTAAPETTISSGPADPTNSSDASFGLGSNEAGSTFECRLDGGSWTACSSPESYTALSDGTHTFEVRATDAAGNQDATPATSTWTIDTAAPDTFISSSPTDPTTATSATFDFTSEPGATFECQLDGGGWAACSSPATYDTLAAGSHTFEVRASDAATNTDPTPAVHTWTIQ